MSSISYGNGATAAYGYSVARGWLNAVTAAKSSTTLVSQSYTRNLAGLITAIAGATAEQSWAYAYDDLGRLIAADAGGTALDQTFRYDLAGNMLFNSALCSGTADNLADLSPFVHPVMGRVLA
ncbi:MAG: hypothetical protein ACK4S3_09800 [Parvibaculum sp.]